MLCVCVRESNCCNGLLLKPSLSSKSVFEVRKFCDFTMCYDSFAICGGCPTHLLISLFFLSLLSPSLSHRDTRINTNTKETYKYISLLLLQPFTKLLLLNPMVYNCNFGRLYFCMQLPRPRTYRSDSLYRYGYIDIQHIHSYQISFLMLSSNNVIRATLILYR